MMHPALIAFGHRLNMSVKRALYSRRGEPYSVCGRTLRYFPGTRPVRLSYETSLNDNARYDALQVRLFSTQLRDGDVAIDVGAHAGQYSILMAAMCGAAGTVISFEPDHYAREKLLRNLRLNPKVKPPIIEPLALSDTVGQASFFTQGGNSQSSLVRASVDGSGSLGTEEISVTVTSLDVYLADKPLRPRWVKIDAEGAEIRILNGARNLLQSDAGFVCELHPYAWSGFGSTFRELQDLVEASGRRIRYLDDTQVLASEPKYGAVLLERRP